jgi:hypothetical protein
MPLTTAEARKFRSLFKKHGGLEQLLPLLPPDLLPHNRGRSPHNDGFMLANLELFVRLAKSEWAMSRNAALHWVFDSSFQKEKSVMESHFGATPSAVVARLKRKLREGGFDKRDITTLAPPEWLERRIDGTVSFRPRHSPRSRMVFAALCVLAPLTEEGRQLSRYLERASRA